MEFSALVPELLVRDTARSLRFYVEVLGFTVEFARPDEAFAYLSLGSAQLMLEEIVEATSWKTGDFDHPLGRGMSLQIRVDAIDPLVSRLRDNDVSLFIEPRDRWYRQDAVLNGQRQFLVQDPDGYLLRFFESLGQVPA